MSSKIAYVNGSATEVNANNWRTLARLKLDEVKAQNPNVTPAENLSIFRAFQQLGGGGDAFTQTNADGAARFNYFGADTVLNNPFVRASDAIEGAQRAVIGQGGVAVLHTISGQAVAAGSSIKNFAFNSVPAAARSAGQKLRDAFDVAGTAAKWSVLGVCAVALVIVVIEVKK